MEEQKKWALAVLICLTIVKKDPIHVDVEKGYFVIYLFLLKLYYLYFSNPVQLNLKFEVR